MTLLATYVRVVSASVEIWFMKYTVTAWERQYESSSPMAGSPILKMLANYRHGNGLNHSAG